MKISIVLSFTILAMVNTAFSQTTCSHTHGANASVTQPTGASFVSATCSTMVVKWTGTTGQQEVVFATYFNSVTNKKDTISGISISCNAAHSCTATIPVAAGMNVTWYVQSIQAIGTDSFYSYPVVGTPVNYPIPACGGVTAAPINNAPVCIGSALKLLANPSGGTPPYTFKWTGPNSFSSTVQEPVIPAMSSAYLGTYTLTVKDNSVIPTMVTKTTVVSSLYPPVTYTVGHTDAVCNGLATGTITINNPSSGLSPFTYRVGTTGNFAPLVNPPVVTANLKAASYRVYVIDSNGCEGVVGPVVVGQPQAITATYAKTDAGCYGAATGSITVTPTSGVAPYTYKLGASGVFGNSNTFSSLRAGTYTVYMKDANGCIISSRVTISQPATAITVTASKTNETCPGAKDGSITATGAGGVSPYKYRLGSTGAYGPANTFSNLKAGNYRIYVSDANGCIGGSVAVAILLDSPTCRSIAIVRNELRGQFKKAASLNTNLYPNPTTHLFTLQMDADCKEVVQLRVIDINGKMVYTAKGLGGQQFKFGEQFATGTYLVEIRQGNEVKTLKAIKVK